MQGPIKWLSSRSEILGQCLVAPRLSHHSVERIHEKLEPSGEREENRILLGKFLFNCLSQSLFNADTNLVNRSKRKSQWRAQTLSSWMEPIYRIKLLVPMFKRKDSSQQATPRKCNRDSWTYKNPKPSPNFLLLSALRNGKKVAHSVNRAIQWKCFLPPCPYWTILN